jgi:formate dehydrogenase subunit gamma
MADVLAAARPLPDAGALQFVSAERPYIDYLTVQQASLHDVMLAYEMDGKPLPREHGAPLRLIIPEMYGYKNVKWLQEINLVQSPQAGYWEELGYDEDAWVGRSNGYAAGAVPPGRSHRVTRYVRRFSRTERALHWANALGFFVLLVSGLMLYLPSLEMAVGRRPLIKDIHFWSGIGWVALLAAVFLLGDRRGLLRTARELETFDADDRAWLVRKRSREGRFNAGQKINAALTAAFFVLFVVSGLLLWLGERDTAFRFASTVVLHDGLMYVSLILLTGHLYLAVIHPATRHSLRGMTLGTVNEDWARWHHPRWTPPE